MARVPRRSCDEIGLPPPFWAFAWAGGQGLARYVLDHPETVAGKRVLDFATGSGLVGIAAANGRCRRGRWPATSTLLRARPCALNAAANGVQFDFAATAT